MSYQKNETGQKFMVLAVNTTNGLPSTGDAANITAKISKDFGSFAALTDTNPTEIDATNAAGVYVFDLSQAETNGDVLTIMPSSSTANVQLDMLNIYTTTIGGQIDDIEDIVGDIDVATTAIENKTAQLTFTVANQVDANALSGGTNPTDITNAVWNPQLSQHLQPGSTGRALQDASVETQNAYVLPISTSDPCAPRGTALTAFINGAATFVLEFKDASGAIVDPTAESLYFVVEDGSTGTDMVVIPDGSLTKTTKNISVTVPGSDNTPIGSYRWAVRTESNEKVLGYGVYNIQYAAQDDTP